MCQHGTFWNATAKTSDKGLERWNLVTVIKLQCDCMIFVNNMNKVRAPSGYCEIVCRGSSLFALNEAVDRHTHRHLGIHYFHTRS
jgi:hypothetical protein